MTHWLKAHGLSAFGIRHGFNLRTGGASRGPAYASWNLGRAVGDDPAHVAENHRRFAERLGRPQGSLFETSQVHGAGVRIVAPGDDPAAVRQCEADALVGPAGGIAVGVRIADCAPVLLFAEDSGAVAAIHAGWRGTVRGVVEAGLRALLAHGGGQSAAVHAAIFPHIRSCCFEVGEEVAAELLAASPDPDVIDRSRPRPHLDLAAVLRAQLLRLGVTGDRIETVPGCTRCEPERFFSYRRDGQHSGRHLAAIVSR